MWEVTREQVFFVQINEWRFAAGGLGGGWMEFAYICQVLQVCEAPNLGVIKPCENKDPTTHTHILVYRLIFTACFRC